MTQVFPFSCPHAGTDLVELSFQPAQRARVLGVPVRLTRLRLSLADPEGFLAALA